MNYKNLLKQRVYFSKKIKKHKVFVSFLFLTTLSFYIYLNHTTSLLADDADCGETTYPEFQSTRPYPKKPCDASVKETALYCGNSLILADNISVEEPLSPATDPRCTLSADGNSYRCNYEISRNTSIAIDLSDAQLPILGNSELSVNSKNYNDEPPGGYLTDAEKVNNYVDWYLKGTTYTPEEERLDTTKQEDIDKIINYSGPLRKLLPQSIIYKSQIESVESAGASQHDQIVTCGLGNTADKCYKGVFRPEWALKRLSDWNVDLLPQKILDKLADLLSKLGLEDQNVRVWEHRYPPLVWDFDSEILYRKAYNEWRGKSCLIAKLPIIKTEKLFCIDNPLVTNMWSDLFAYVPLTSNEDRVGQVFVDSTGVSASDPDVEITNVKLTSTPADLYFSHTEEVSDLANLLQSTFKPGSANETTSKTGTNSFSLSSSNCYLLNVRSNPGDNLYAGEILGDLSYDAKFHCSYSTTEPGQTCTKDTSIALSVKTKTPKAEEIWDTLVSGTSSVFKRIFPKIGEKSPILGLLDIPGSTTVTYSGNNLVSVSNPSERSSSPAELYFAHLGAVDEYFMKGIQTALRPKGFGTSILSGNPDQFLVNGSANCNQNAPAPNLPNLLSPQDMYNFAVQNVGLDGNNVLKCYNDVAAKAGAAGVDSIFTFTIWLRESNASNYNISFQDFGINDASVLGFTDQIEAFFRTVKSGLYKSCACDSSKGWPNPMYGFLTMYRTGDCVKSATGDKYYETTLFFWNTISRRPFNPNVLPTGETCN